MLSVNEFKINLIEILWRFLKYENDYQKYTDIEGLYLGTEHRLNRATEFIYQQQQDIERINREIREKEKRKHELRELEQEFYALVKEQILNYIFDDDSDIYKIRFSRF